MMLQISHRMLGNILRRSSPLLLQVKNASSQQTKTHDKRNSTWLVVSCLIGATTASGLLSIPQILPQCAHTHEGFTLNSLPSMQETEQDDEDFDLSLPTYTSAEVAFHDGKRSNKVWMSYGGFVYDVTEFVANHPGGREKILLAAGGAIEPFWHLYRQHFASDLPLRLMEKMIIGRLNHNDQDKIDAEMEKLMEAGGDPYENEPDRHPLLIVHSDTPMNAEVPADIMTREYITPTKLFYIRNHHPVPLLNDEDMHDFRLEVNLTELIDDTSANRSKKRKVVAKLSLEQIKSLPKVEIVSTLQCSGNRRSGFNNLRQTSGTNWGQGAISTAKWGGVRLIDVLQHAAQLVDAEVSSNNDKNKAETLITNEEAPLLKTLQTLQHLLEKHLNLQHLRIESLDGMHASIPIIKALSPFGDVILAYEMNGRPLPRDHGFPLRLVVPGYAAVRNVKWVSKLELNQHESEGPWQRGLNYKILPPAAMNATGLDLNLMPGLTEEPVISGITKLEKVASKANQLHHKPGDTVMINANGWAWAGGGRNIVRVDVTGDDGKSWETAKITQGGNQPFGRAWAWVFWECENIPAKVLDDGHSVEVSCKGVDTSFNTQPQYVDGMWNVRGLANNSWFRSKLRV